MNQIENKTANQTVKITDESKRKERKRSAEYSVEQDRGSKVTKVIAIGPWSTQPKSVSSTKTTPRMPISTGAIRKATYILPRGTLGFISDLYKAAMDPNYQALQFVDRETHNRVVTQVMSDLKSDLSTDFPLILY